MADRTGFRGRREKLWAWVLVVLGVLRGRSPAFGLHSRDSMVLGKLEIS